MQLVRYFSVCSSLLLTATSILSGVEEGGDKLNLSEYHKESLRTDSLFGDKPVAHHLGFSVANLDKMIEWYEKNLNFKVTKRLDHPQYGYRIVFLENKGFSVEFIEQKDSKKYELAFKDPAEQTKMQGIVHFAFKVDDVDKTAEELRKRGVKFAWEPRTVKEVQMRFFHIFDPEGNLIEFTQDL